MTDFMKEEENEQSISCLEEAEHHKIAPESA